MGDTVSISDKFFLSVFTLVHGVRAHSAPSTERRLKGPEQQINERDVKDRHFKEDKLSALFTYIHSSFYVRIVYSSQSFILLYLYTACNTGTYNFHVQHVTLYIIIRPYTLVNTHLDYYCGQIQCFLNQNVFMRLYGMYGIMYNSRLKLNI